MIDSLIFDLDGTLWDATEMICKTWNIILNDYPQIERESITVEELTHCMGLQLDVIGRKLFPDTEVGLRTELMDKCCALECEYLARFGGNLYPELEETLKYLNNKYRLFVVSNCQEGYIESFFSGHGLGAYFTDYISAGHTGLSKGENNRLIMKKNKLKSPVYVGDTQGDKQSADDAGIPFVYAAYGFGKPVGYDYIINKFSDLKRIF